MSDKGIGLVGGGGGSSGVHSANYSVSTQGTMVPGPELGELSPRQRALAQVAYSLASILKVNMGVRESVAAAI